MGNEYELYYPDAEPFSDEFCRQCDEYDAQLAKIVTENRAVLFSCAYGFYIVSPSAKQAGYTQVSFLDLQKIPTADSQYRNEDIRGIIHRLSNDKLKVLEVIHWND